MNEKTPLEPDTSFHLSKCNIIVAVIYGWTKLLIVDQISSFMK